MQVDARRLNILSAPIQRPVSGPFRRRSSSDTPSLVRSTPGTSPSGPRLCHPIAGNSPERGYTSTSVFPSSSRPFFMT